MRLKWLLHCVQCHFVLLMLVGFAVAGYVLRGDLAILLGWHATSETPSAVVVPEQQGAEDRPAAPFPSPTGRGVPDPSAAGTLSTPGLGAAAEERFDPRSSLSHGEFRFRPMDDVISTGGSDVDAERRGEWLAVARRAYWNHNVPLALRHYQALTRAYPNEPDIYGEMGNIYYEQGDHELAGQAYYQAAVLLLRRGQRTRARELADLLRKTAPALAEDLMGRLEGTR